MRGIIIVKCMLALMAVYGGLEAVCSSEGYTIRRLSEIQRIGRDGQIACAVGCKYIL